eukprot:ANDGO_02753.mRNA.1 hypothetical protein
MIPLLKEEVESSPYQFVIRVRPPLQLVRREPVPSSSSSTSAPGAAGSLNPYASFTGSSLQTVVAVGEDHRTLHVSCDPFDDSSYATFRFSRVFGDTTRQSSLYSKAVRPLLDVVLDNCLDPKEKIHGTVIVAGPANSGKSHTCWGTFSPRELSQWGIFPRLVSDILLFEHQRRSRKMQFSLSMSCVYLHGDNVLSDALDPKRSVRNLRIRDHTNSSVTGRPGSTGGLHSSLPASGPHYGGVHPSFSATTSDSGEEIDIPELTKYAIQDPGQALQYLKKAISVCPATHHAIIVSLYIEMVEMSSTVRSAGGHGLTKRRVRKMHIVKLNTVREAAKPLNALALVSQALFHKTYSAAAASQLHPLDPTPFLSGVRAPSAASAPLPFAPTVTVPPYRDSKLVHFLKDAMQPDSPFLFLTTVGPEDEFRAATVACVRYAHRLFASQLSALVQFLHSRMLPQARDGDDSSSSSASWTLWSIPPTRKAQKEEDNPVKSQKWSVVNVAAPSPPRRQPAKRNDNRTPSSVHGNRDAHASADSGDEDGGKPAIAVAAASPSPSVYRRKRQAVAASSGSRRLISALQDSSDDELPGRLDSAADEYVGSEAPSPAAESKYEQVLRTANLQKKAASRTQQQQPVGTPRLSASSPQQTRDQAPHRQPLAQVSTLGTVSPAPVFTAAGQDASSERRVEPSPGLPPRWNPSTSGLPSQQATSSLQTPTSVHSHPAFEAFHDLEVQSNNHQSLDADDSGVLDENQNPQLLNTSLTDSGRFASSAHGSPSLYDSKDNATIEEISGAQQFRRSRLESTNWTGCANAGAITTEPRDAGGAIPPQAESSSSSSVRRHDSQTVSEDRLRFLYLDLQSSYQRLSEEHGAMESELMRLRAGYANTKERAEQLDEVCAELETNLVHEQSRRESEEKKFKAELSENRERSTELEKRLEELTDRCGEYSRHAAELAEALSTLRGERDRWREETSTLASKQQHAVSDCLIDAQRLVETLKQRIQQVSTTIQAVRLEAGFPDEMRDGLSLSLLDYDAEDDAEARDFMRRFAALLKSRPPFSRILDAFLLHQQRAFARLWTRLSSEIRHMLAQSSRRLADSQAENGRLRERVSDLEHRVKVFEEERKAVLMASADVKIKASHNESQLQRHEETIAALRKALSDARIEAESVKAQAEEVPGLKQALEDRSATLTDAVDRMRGLEFEVRETAAENERLQMRLHEVETRASDSEARQVALRKEMDVLQLTAGKFERQLRDSQAEISSLYAEREKTQRDIAELVAAIHEGTGQ